MLYFNKNHMFIKGNFLLCNQLKKYLLMSELNDFFDKHCLAKKIYKNYDKNHTAFYTAKNLAITNQTKKNFYYDEANTIIFYKSDKFEYTELLNILQCENLEIYNEDLSNEKLNAFIQIAKLEDNTYVFVSIQRDEDGCVGCYNKIYIRHCDCFDNLPLVGKNIKKYKLLIKQDNLTVEEKNFIVNFFTDTYDYQNCNQLINDSIANLNNAHMIIDLILSNSGCADLVSENDILQMFSNDYNNNLHKTAVVKCLSLNKKLFDKSHKIIEHICNKKEYYECLELSGFLTPNLVIEYFLHETPYDTSLFVFLTSQYCSKIDKSNFLGLESLFCHKILYLDNEFIREYRNQNINKCELFVQNLIRIIYGFEGNCLVGFDYFDAIKLTNYPKSYVNRILEMIDIVS